MANNQPALSPDQVRTAYGLMAIGVPLSAVARKFSVSRLTMYHSFKREGLSLAELRAGQASERAGA